MDVALPLEYLFSMGIDGCTATVGFLTSDMARGVPTDLGGVVLIHDGETCPIHEA